MCQNYNRIIHRSIIGTLILASLLIAQVDPWDSSISWNISGETVFSTSKHFDIRKTPTHEDKTPNNPSPAQADMTTAFGYLENAFRVYHENMKFSVPDSNSAVKHKIRVYLYEKIGALYGGVDQYGPGIWMGLGGLRDNWGLSHEYSHGLQSLSGGLQGSEYANWFYESHANWMAHQVIPTSTHCSDMLVNYPYLYYGSTRDRYCNWQFFEYLKDNHGGTDVVNNIWRLSLRNNNSARNQETPFTALMRNKNWTVSNLNDTMGAWAMHNVTWDYSNGALYRSSYGSYDNRERQRRNRVTMLDSLDGNNRYFSPDYWAPQAYGYNLVRIYPSTTGANSTITVKFRGVVQTSPQNTTFGNFKYQPTSIPNPNSDWRWGVVAIQSNGSPRYSALQKGSATDMNFDVLANDQAMYMVVMATPSVYTRIFWDQMYYTIYRYPWMVEFVNAKPEGYQPNAWPTTGTTCRPKTTNWQGCVASTATVDASVIVAPNARILGTSRVTGNVKVEDYATIRGGTVSGNAIIRDQARVMGGTVAENAILEGHASVYGGTVNGYAMVGALSLVDGGTVTGNGKFYGVMNQLGNGVTISGTAQMLGDNEISTSISQGVFYGMLDVGMKNEVTFGSARTAPVVEVTKPGPYIWPNTQGSSAAVSSATGVSSSSSAGVCTQSFVPYHRVNAGTWTNNAAVRAFVGDSVSFAPQPASGVWSWTGPNGYVATDRQITLKSLTLAQSGTYNASVNVNGCVYQGSIQLTIESASPVRNLVKNIIFRAKIHNQVLELQLPQGAKAWRLADMFGNVRMQGHETGSVQKSMAQIQSGIYLLQVDLPNGPQSQIILNK